MTKSTQPADGIEYGQMVEPIERPTGTNWLRSGGEAYAFAIVASLEPFILVSERGDMVWQATVQRENFRAIGKASERMMIALRERMSREQGRLAPLMKAAAPAGDDACEAFAAKARQLVLEAALAGVVLTIDQVPQKPLAMRHYETRVSARKAR